jgi:hypothetical protein
MRALLLLFLACGPAPIVLTSPTSPASESTQSTPPAENDAQSESTEPSVDPTTAPPCDVRIDTQVLAQPNGTFLLRASLTSLVGPRDVTIPDACPNGSATFRGLPEPYDYYATCNAGPCVTTSPRAIPLGDAPIVIAEASVDPRASTCNAALPSGLYLVSAELALPNLRLCTNRAATLTVPG